MPLDARERGERLLVGQRLGGVVQFEQFRQFAGLLRFVVRAFAETDRIRVLRTRHGGDVAGVDTARQEGADLHIGDLVRLDGIAHRLVDRVHQLAQLLLAFAEILVVIPVDVHLAIPVREIVPFRQLVDAFEEGLTDRRILEGHIRLQRLGVELLDEIGVAQQALDLRRVHERAVHLRIVEGLMPKWSRAPNSSCLFLSQITKVNMPRTRCSKSTPHCS